MSVETSSGGVGGSEPPAGAIFSRALRICREHWRALAVYGLLAGVPGAAFDAATALDRGIDPFATPLSGNPTAAGADTLASSVLSIVLYALASAATVHTVAAGRDGREIGWREGLGLGARRFGGVVAASFIVVILVALGLLALVLPGIWIAVALALTTPALVLESLTPLAAVRRSFTMVTGRWWKTAAVVGLAILAAFAALVAVSVPAGVLASLTGDQALRAMLAALVNALGTAVLVPITVGVTTVLFLERRAAGGIPPAGDEGARYRGFTPPLAPERRPDAPSGWAPPGRGSDAERLPPPSAEPPRREPPAA